MRFGYDSSGPFEVSEQLLLDMMTRRFAPAGKGAPVPAIPFTEPYAERRELTVLHLASGEEWTARAGWGPYAFSQQSMSKPSAACFLMELLGFDYEGVRIFEQHLGNQYSGMPYNGINLMANGNPYNYSDNIGALKVWKLIVEKIRETDPHGDPFERFYRWFCRLTGTTTPSPSFHMAEGEYGEDGRNWVLLQQLGLQRDTPRWREVYYSYCRACAIKITTLEMATVFGTLANGGTNPRTKQAVIWPHIAKHVYDGMARHGAYDESVKYRLKAGLYSKTGVDGGIMGQLNTQLDFAFCGHHCDLNPAGNSGEMLKWIVDMSEIQLVLPGAGGRLRLPDGVPTGKALDDLLFRVMKPTTLSALQTSLDAHIAANYDDGGKIYIDKASRRPTTGRQGFYLKLNPGSKELGPGSHLLAEGTDTAGELKQYYFMPDSYGLHKIVVEPVRLGRRKEIARQFRKHVP